MAISLREKRMIAECKLLKAQLKYEKAKRYFVECQIAELEERIQRKSATK